MTLDQYKDDYAQQLFGRTKADAHKAGICLDCGASVFFDINGWGPGSIYSHAGLKEYGISGLCEYCFDSLFDGEED